MLLNPLFYLSPSACGQPTATQRQRRQYLATAFVWLSLLLPSRALCQESRGEKKVLVRTEQEKLAYFLKLTDTLRQKTHNPGLAIAIIYQQKLLYQGGMGYRDVARKLPVTPSTLFEIGSCSKAFTGVVAAQLVQQGALNWTDEVVKYLPEFKLADAYATEHATLLDLLTHRVGLAQHYYLQYGPTFTRPEVLAKLPFLSFDGTFREKFIYNNLLYTVAGIVEEKTTNTPWPDLVASRIFKPLGMNSSFATFQEFQRYPENTVSYKADGRTIVPPASIDAVAPAGGISSTITDMARWLQMLVGKGQLLGREFLSAKQFAYLTSPLTVRNAAEEIFYGIGWDIDTKRKIIYHDGRTAGQSARILFIPEKGFGIVILCNQHTELQNLLIRYATNIFVDNNYENMADFEAFVLARAQPAASAPASKSFAIQDATVAKDLKAYTGRYTHPAYGTITLTSPRRNELHFQYYDFKGPARHNAGLSFIAFTQHQTGADQFEFKFLKDSLQQSRAWK